MRHPGVGKVSFTGGTATARLVMAAAAETLTPLALELGGKSANVIFPDADLDAAVQASAFLGCTPPQRPGLRAAAPGSTSTTTCTTRWSSGWWPGRGGGGGRPARPPDVDGPGRHRGGVRADPRRRSTGPAREGAGTLLTGGARLGGDLAGGYFVAPTVFGDVDHGSDLARNEIFGPVLSVLRFADEDEVVAQVNDSDYGLGAYLHTRDVARALRLATAFEAGSVTVERLPGRCRRAPRSVGTSRAASAARAAVPASRRWSAARTSSSASELRRGVRSGRRARRAPRRRGARPGSACCRARPGRAAAR